MQSRYQAGDDENGSFAATRSKLQDRKPGAQAATPRGAATTEGKYRRNASKENVLNFPCRSNSRTGG